MDERAAGDRKRAMLSRLRAVCGGIVLVSCGALSWLSFDPSFEHGEGFERRPILAVVAWLGIASLAWLLAAWSARVSPPRLRSVLVVALLARLVLLVSWPIQEDDIYRYLWDGRVVAAGLDPYVEAPRTVLEALEGREGIEARPAHVEVARRSVATRTILARVNHGAFHSIYPVPLQLLFGLHGSLVPEGWSVHAQVVAMKALLGVFDLLVIALVVLLLRGVGAAPGLGLFYAWCPLVLKELWNSGHLDAFPAAWLLGALFLVVVGGRSRLGRARVAAAGALLGVAVAAKVFAIVVVPLLWRRLGWRDALLLTALVAAVVGGSWLVYSEGAAQRDVTLQLFALFWENHAGIYSWVERASSIATGASELVVEVGGERWVIARSRVVARIVVGLAFASVLAWHTWRARRGESARRFLERVFITLVALFLLGPLGFPWYFVWCAPLMVFARRRAWLVLPGLLMVYYLGFWYDYQSLTEDGLRWFDDVIVTLEYSVFFTLLGLEVVGERRCRRRSRLVS